MKLFNINIKMQLPQGEDICRPTLKENGYIIVSHIYNDNSQNTFMKAVDGNALSIPSFKTNTYYFTG